MNKTLVSQNKQSKTKGEHKQTTKQGNKIKQCKTTNKNKNAEQQATTSGLRLLYIQCILYTTPLTACQWITKLQHFYKVVPYPQYHNKLCCMIR